MENKEEFEKLRSLVEETKSKNGVEDKQKSSPAQIKPGYDPAKKYTWEPGSQFLLAGEEFGIVLNAVRAILNTPEAQRILILEKASKAIDNSLARAIQVGVAQEAKQ